MQQTRLYTYLILVIGLLSIQQVSSLNFVECYFGNRLCTSGDVFNETNPSIVQFTWTRNKGKTPSAQTGPDTDQNTGTAEGYYMYIETSTPRVVNDKARLYTSTLDSGKYTVEFWFIANGANLGGLSVFTREDASLYARLIWYYSYNLDSKVDVWTKVNVEISRESSFHVEFDGWRGTTGLGDIAIDSIRISRDGDAVTTTAPAVANIPFRCTFEDGNCGFEIVDFRSQFSWARQSGGRTTSGTGPDADHTLNSWQGNWMLMDASDAPTPRTGMRAVLRSPTFWPKCGCFYLDFYYYAYGSDLNKLEVWVDGYDTPIDTMPGRVEGIRVSRAEWIHIRRTVRIAEPTQLLFIGYAGDTVHGDFAIDDVVLEQCSEEDARCEKVNECETGQDTCHTNAFCTDTDSFYFCTCNSGYEGDGESCTNINECSTGDHTCHTNAVCTDTDGAYTCACTDGYEGNGKSCTNVNECNTGAHRCHAKATCTDTTGSYTCACNSGYEGTGRACTNINECAQGSDNCDANAKCVDTVGSFDCACDAGFVGDGKSCTNGNECNTGEHNCHKNAFCTDIVGSYNCTCNDGYTGNGITCSNVNECNTRTFTCDPNAACTDTVGSYTCTCNDGYQGNGKSCTNVNECNTGEHNCHKNAFCTDIVGSYNCTCNDGYKGNGRWCNNVNECNTGTFTCDSNAACTDIVGSYTCTCNDGYEGDGKSCTNSNECTDGDHTCDINAVCTDAAGSYNCTCKSGFEGDGETCTNIDECEAGVHTCAADATCSNTVGSYTCACNPGYEGNGKSCTNIDECNTGSHKCDVNAICTDTDGSYTCTCQFGSSGDGRTCSLSRGQHVCRFNTNFCNYVQPAVGLMWQIVGQDAGRQPTDDVPGGGQFAYVDAGQQANTDVAMLTTDSIVLNPNSCHIVTFRHSISAGKGGTLRLLLIGPSSDDSVMELWSSDTVTNGWADTVTVKFRYYDSYKLRFEAKRVIDGGNFALDNVEVPLVNCTGIPLYPESDTSTAIENPEGTLTEVSGTGGVLESPNYPNFYPDSVLHAWSISVDKDSVIELTVITFKTDNSDKLEARDGIAGAPLFSLSGTLASDDTNVYKSTSNEVNLVFSTDDETASKGWKIEWRAVPLVATTPKPVGYEQCFFATNSACPGFVTPMTDTDYRWKWWSGQGPNYPDTGPAADSSGSGGYLLMDSSAPATSEVGSFMVGPVFHNSGKHRLEFAYNAFGSNMGSLAVAVVAESGISARRKRQVAADSSENLWLSAAPSEDKWHKVTKDFEQEGMFSLMFTAKRKKDSAGLYKFGDLAVDNITITNPPADGTEPIPANGGTTYLTEVTTKDIKSPYYPKPYKFEVAYSHVWDITSLDGTAVVINVETFSTEACCDIVKLVDPLDNNKEIAVLSGGKPGVITYRASGNRLQIQFSADDKIAGDGFYLTWRAEPATTTLAQIGSTGAQVNPGSDTLAWWVYLIIVLLIIAIFIILIMVVVICIRKRNARLNKTHSSQEELAGRGSSVSPAVSPQLTHGFLQPNYNHDALSVSHIHYPPKTSSKRASHTRQHTVLPPHEIHNWSTDVPHYNYEGKHVKPKEQANNIPEYFYSSSPSQLAGSTANEHKPIQYGEEYTPQTVYGHHYDKPAHTYYYDNGSMGECPFCPDTPTSYKRRTMTSNLNESGHYSFMHFDASNVITNPLKKKVELDQNGQPIQKRRSKRAKKLDPLRESRRSYNNRPESGGIISLPDGQGNTAPQTYNHVYSRDNPPDYDN